MNKDLTVSEIERQNILNNQYALDYAKSYLSLGGILYEGEDVFTKEHLVSLFSVSESTIEKYISTHGDELKSNGYFILKGFALKNFKALQSGTVINYGTKTTVLGLFKFRTVLNLAMLISESESAKIIRNKLLDIVMDVVAQRSGGHTKFINQRDQNYLPASFQEYSYRKLFTKSLKEHLEMGDIKYAIYTDKIYQIIFKENSKEYKKILKLAQKDNLRETLYSEVLTIIGSIENGLATEIEQLALELNRKITPAELNKIMNNAESNPYLKPLIDDSRVKMASRDLCFRDILHNKLADYIQTVPTADFDRFLGETSQSLENRLKDPETLNVLKRLKDK